MADTLPAAAWTKRKDLNALVTALGGPASARWVGGAVRDTLLGVEVKDIDCATPHPPLDVIRRLARAGIKSAPTGIEHGTVTALLAGGTVEITTLRRDVSTDGRRATVEYATEWEDDAARRDFTINALYADPKTLEIFDYFGGTADLDARLVRFIGNAEERIREDHLRILRYYRFQARFGALLDGEAEEACAALAPMLKGLSRERVAMELLNLLSEADPTSTVARMHERKVLQEVLPETTRAQIAALAALVEAERTARIAPDPVRRLAALLPPSPPVAETVAARLRLSKAQRGRLSGAAGRVQADVANPRALAWRESKESAIDRLLLLGGGVDALEGWDVPALPLKGGEIVAKGVTAGPKVAKILRQVEQLWVEEGFPPRKRVEQILAQVLAG
jgi:poly(A) polymerase